MGFRLGISSWTFPWSIGVPGHPAPFNPLRPTDLVKKAREFGVRVVQVADNLPLHKLSPRQLQELKETAEECGVELEVGTRGLAAEHLLAYLEIAVSLRAHLLRTIPVITETGSADVGEITRRLEEVLPRFAAAGVAIALENYEACPARDLARLVRSFASPYLGICLDTVNNLGALEPPAYVLAELGPYTINLHIKDFVIKRIETKMGFSVTGAPAGSGLLDIPN